MEDGRRVWGRRCVRTDKLVYAFETFPDRGGKDDVDIGGLTLGCLGRGCLLQLFDREEARNLSCRRGGV